MMETFSGQTNEEGFPLVKVKKEEKDEEEHPDFDYVCAGLERIKEQFGSGNGQEYVYFMDDGYAVKIGQTGDLHKRRAGVQTGNPRPVVVVHKYECNQARPCELALQQLFSHVHTNGEWFFLTELHMGLIKAILKPRKHEIVAPDRISDDKQQRLNKRKRAFAEFVASFSDVLDAREVHNFLQNRAILTHDATAAEEYIRDTLTPIFSHSRRSYVVAQSLQTSFETTYENMGPLFSKFGDVDLDRYEKERLIRLLQYRLFSKGGWKPTQEVHTARGLALMHSLRASYDPLIFALVDDLLGNLGLSSALPPGDIPEIAQGKFVVTFWDRRLSCIGIEPAVFSANTQNLKLICSKLRRICKSRQKKDNDVIVDVRGTVAIVFGALLRKTNGIIKGKTKLYWIQHDTRDLAWIRNFELYANELPE
jgi:hypothetical protein